MAAWGMVRMVASTLLLALALGAGCNAVMGFAEGSLAPATNGGASAAGGEGTGGTAAGAGGGAGQHGGGDGGGGTGGSAGQGGAIVSGCDPLDPAPFCGSGQHCVPQLCPSSTPQCLGPTGAGTQDASCASRSACADVFECVDLGTGSGTCVRWCRVGFGDCADLGTQYACTGLSPAVCIETQQWGVCHN